VDVVRIAEAAGITVDSHRTISANEAGVRNEYDALR